MRIVQDLGPPPKPWLYLRLYPDGRRIHHTGTVTARGIPGWYRGRDEYDALAVNNITFEARLRPINGAFHPDGKFEDVEDGALYWANDGLALEILCAAVRGEHGCRVENGLVAGTFTFRNHGGTVNIALWTGDAARRGIREHRRHRNRPDAQGEAAGALIAPAVLEEI